MESIIKDSLPYTPTDIIDIWLAPIAKNYGWPPSQYNNWRYVLGKERRLEYLQCLDWTLNDIELIPKMIIPHDFDIVTELFKSYVLKQKTIYSMTMPDGFDRFQKCCEYIKSNGIFPRPIIIENINNLYHIFDGYHRLTAFFYLYGFFNVSKKDVHSLKVQSIQKAWIAKKRTM